jgi:hypothetical protein
MTRFDPHRIRSGDEPMHARSPLRMRLTMAVIGFVSAVAGILFFASQHATGWVTACAVIALLTLADAVVVVRHIRAGPHYQPGRDIPPYRPVEEPEDRRPYRGPLPQRTRETVYLAMMGVCLTLVILAWTVVRLFSSTAAVVMSVIAAFIPPFAVMVANARGRDG